MATEKIPEANPVVLQQVDDMLDDPVAYLQRVREVSRREARAYVDREVSRRLAEQQNLRVSLGQRILRWLRAQGAAAPPASG